MEAPIPLRPVSRPSLVVFITFVKLAEFEHAFFVNSNAALQASSSSGQRCRYKRLRKSQLKVTLPQVSKHTVRIPALSNRL